jgi:predicted DCC family thiol-disulfide oxidoreductase YuxK
MGSMSHLPLPTPKDHPEADVVIYDGHCQFCTRQVERLHRWDSSGRLAFLSLHDPAVSEYVPHLSHEQLMEQMYVVDRQGHARGGAQAFQYLTRHLFWLWPFAPLMHIPFTLPLWQWLYGQVAKRRYRWNSSTCENGTCPIHFR